MRANGLGSILAAAVTALLVSAAAGQSASSSAHAEPAPALPAKAKGDQPIRFNVARTTVRAGHTRIVAFRRADSAAFAALELRATSGDPGIVEALTPARLMEGEPIGYIRIRGVAAGTTSLAVGGAAIQIDVVPAEDAVGVAPPAIDGPATGAAVWGRIAVGMHFTATASSESDTPRIIVDDGAHAALEARWVTGPEHGPVRLAAFSLDADALDAGVHSLTPVVLGADGEERAGQPVQIRIVRPREADLVEGEAETALPVERPEQYGQELPAVRQDGDASGGAFAVNNSAYPPVCFPLKVEEAGWYQVMLRAGGTLAGGALPTVALLADDEALTNAPLLTVGWHRLALGVPVLLRPGEHAIIPFFGNDFYVAGLADRNLWLDRIEILRVADAEGYAEAGDVFGAGTMAGTNAGDAPMTDGESEMMGEEPMQMQDAMMSAMTRTSAAGVGVGPVRVAIDGFDDLAALDRSRVRVAFARSYHNVEATGQLEVNGVCWWDGMRDSKPAPPPIVALEVNGWEISRQRSSAPAFWIDAAYFTQRENTIRLIARLDDGTEAASALQTVIAPWLEEGALPSGMVPPRACWRFTIHDAGWSESISRHLRSEHDPRERFCAAFYSNAVATLTLPEQIEGDFEIYIEARGQPFDGPPVLQITLEDDDGVEEVEPLRVPEGWGPHHAGRLAIPAGAKELKLAYRNDKYQVGRGDRNLWLQSVVLQEVAPTLQPVTPSHAAPEQAAAPVTIEISYPLDGHDAWMADALVARAYEQAGGIASAELLWDGVPTGLRLDITRGVNPIVLPLALRDVEPGEHAAAVRITDLAGKVVDSGTVHINVLSQPPMQAGPFARAAHLLNRFAYGPGSDELAAVLTRGERAWLEGQLRTGPDDPGLLNAVAMGMIRFGDRRSPYDVPRRAIEQARTSPVPARDRLVLWAENHFSTWIRKCEATRKCDEHLAFTRVCGGRAVPFIDLLAASATSPAMLRYLDQDQSFAGKINENYAREIMELHTLGVHGGYDQQDVMQLAGLLTGWMAADEGDGRSGGQGAIVHHFRFDPALCDPAPRDIVGFHFAEADSAARYARAREALELLAAHPATAHHVCAQLAAQYVDFPPDEAAVDHLASVFMETGGDLSAVLLEIAGSDAFWAELEDGRQRLTKPLEHGLRFARATGEPITPQIAEYLDLCGMGLFDRPTPDGYPEEDQPYSDSNAMLQRWRLATRVEGPIATLVPGPWRWADPDADPAADLDEPAARRIADLICIRLTGGALSEPSLKAAVSIMLEEKGTREERIRRGAMLVGQLPEASLK